MQQKKQSPVVIMVCCERAFTSWLEEMDAQQELTPNQSASLPNFSVELWSPTVSVVLRAAFVRTTRLSFEEPLAS